MSVAADARLAVKGLADAVGRALRHLLEASAALLAAEAGNPFVGGAHSPIVSTDGLASSL